MLPESCCGASQIAVQLFSKKGNVILSEVRKANAKGVLCSTALLKPDLFLKATSS
jgi:hypothetical protein